MHSKNNLHQPFLFGIFTLLMITLFSCNRNNEKSIQQESILDLTLLSELQNARNAFERGLYAEAEGILDSLESVQPTLPDIYYLEGEIYTRMKQFEMAKAAYEQTLELDPDYQGALFKLGHVAFSQDKFREAISYYQREKNAITEDGNEYEHVALNAVLIQLGRCYDHLGKTDSAIYIYNEALERDSTNAEIYADLGQLYKNNGDFTKGLEYYRKALHYSPDNIEYQYFYGYLLLQTGQTKDAVQHLKSVIEEQPWHYGAHYNFGRALIATGKQEQAEKQFAIADSLQDIDYDISTARWTVEVYPDNMRRWVELGDLYRSVGRNREALEAYRTALFLEPENLLVQNKAANTCFNLGYTAEAISRYKSVLQRDSTSSNVWFNLGVAYMQSGNVNRARFAMRKALTYNPDLDVAREYLSRLE